MATNEYKARALFDFHAEGPSELSLTAGEIITITSDTNGNDWWYAQNSVGQFGAVPATYVELINDQSNATNIRTTSEASYQVQLENEQPKYMTSTPINNSDSALGTYEQSNHSTEQDFTPDSSYDSLSAATGNDNLIDSAPSTSNDFDPYRTIMDSSLPTSTRIANQQVPPSRQEQQNSLLGDLMHSSSPNVSTPVQSMRTSSINDLPTDHSSITSPSTKHKPEKTKLFTLKRNKQKPELDKRRLSVGNGLEPSKEDSDSDAQSDSASPHNSLSSSNKHSLGVGDSKTTARAKVFDKHGVGNYLLHECKTKPDEHVQIAYDENEGGVCWSPNPNVPPFTCKIENPSKGTKFSGLKSFVEYQIHPQIPGSRVVSRRYKQFDWLHEQLLIKYRYICIPTLPGKQIAGRFEQEFIEDRRRQLELWLNRICHHPVLCASFPVQHFITCELTEKNNKDWKAGKRKIEKDELRESSWLYCVTFTESNLSDTEIANQIDAFAQQQPGLETHLKNLNHGFSKYLDKHTEIYERDIQRVGDLFTKLHVVVQVDVTTRGNDQLSNTMSKISNSYNGIAELYKTKGYEGIRDFIERIQDYIGLLACFPIIINLQRSAAEYIRNAQQHRSSPDYNGILHRNQVLNYVVLAEINFFQKEKVNDLKLYMKSLLDEQVQFYEKVTSELREAMSTFD